MSYKVISPENFSENIFNKIGKDWMLISAYDRDKVVKCNGMTASWGGMGVLWNKNIFWCVIRPQRYTKEFVDKSDKITLSFFDEKYRDALSLCGRKSGRDCNKLSLANLTPVVGKDGEVIYEEAKITFVGRKLYCQQLKEECFIDKSLIAANYPSKDFHYVYVCEILEIRES